MPRLSNIEEGWKENGLKLTPKLWQHNKVKIEKYIAKENLKLSTLCVGISSVENTCKQVELMSAEQNVKTKNK